MTNQEWLEQLKVGDTVFATRQWYAAAPRKVERITPTQIIVNGAKYNKRNGHEIGGGSYCSGYIYEPTEELWKTFRKANNIAKINKIVWNDVSDNKLRDIVDILSSDDKIRRRNEIRKIITNIPALRNELELLEKETMKEDYVEETK